MANAEPAPRMGSAWRRTIRRLRGWLRGDFNSTPPRVRPWTETYTHIVWVTRFFYAFGLLFAFYMIEAIYGIENTATIDPHWPIFWITDANLVAAKSIIIVGLAVSVFLANIFYDRILPRILFFIFVLQSVAIVNSFGSINHYGHFVTWVSFCFCLLPSMQAAKPVAKSHAAWAIAVFSFTQILICLFYTLSGLYKAKGGVIVATGGVSGFAPDALAYLVAERLGKIGNEPMLASILLDGPWLGWPAHLFVIYFEVFAIVAVFRPRLHRVFGISTAFFHVLVWFVLGIAFHFQAFVVLLLFAYSPFCPKDVTWREVLRDLPLFGDAWRLVTTGGNVSRRSTQ